MDESVMKHLEVRKLSDLVRDVGYGDPMDYEDCLLGRAYKRLTGRSLSADGFIYVPTEKFMLSGCHLTYTQRAADEFCIPWDVALKAETMCYGRTYTPDEIADYIASQGY